MSNPFFIITESPISGQVDITFKWGGICAGIIGDRQTILSKSDTEINELIKKSYQEE